MGIPYFEQHSYLIVLARIIRVQRNIFAAFKAIPSMVCPQMPQETGGFPIIKWL